MEELEYINSRVSEIASDEADAKCGMSMNPNLDGVLRVTVVATGLPGNKHMPAAAVAPQQNPKVAQFVRPELNVPAGPAMPPLGSPKLDIPAVHRQQRKYAAGGGSAFPLGLDEDIINIPAFLRNQAD